MEEVTIVDKENPEELPPQPEPPPFDPDPELITEMEKGLTPEDEGAEKRDS